MRTQHDGWPVGTNEYGKEAILRAVRDILGGEGNALSTDDLAARVSDRIGWHHPVDVLRVAVECACGELGAERRWSLGA